MVLRVLPVVESSLLVSSGNCDHEALTPNLDAKTVKVWDVKSGQCVKTLTGVSDVSAVECYGNYLFTGLEDSNIKVSFH
jgi:WD40 repeat protein